MARRRRHRQNVTVDFLSRSTFCRHRRQCGRDYSVRDYRCYWIFKACPQRRH